MSHYIFNHMQLKLSDLHKFENDDMESGKPHSTLLSLVLSLKVHVHANLLAQSIVHSQCCVNSKVCGFPTDALLFIRNWFS